MTSASSSSSLKFPEEDRKLLRTLLRLSRDLSAWETPRSLFQRYNVVSFRRKAKLLSFLFEDLLHHGSLPSAASLCLRELHPLLRRFGSLLDKVSIRMSRVRLALQFDSVSSRFHDLTRDLSTLLDLLPDHDDEGILLFPDDLSDLLRLLRSHCSHSSPEPSEEESLLRSEILQTIGDVEREIAPDHRRLQDMFDRLGLGDPQSCRDEIDRLEVEIRDGAGGGRWSAAMISLLGLVRYAKFVLFGASTPRGTAPSRSPSMSETAVPSDFRCPISLELIMDPVVAASGQTYDRSSIERWIASGHSTCPKTGQDLSHLRLIPNLSLRNIIFQWCKEQNIPFEGPDPSSSSSSSSSTATSKKQDADAANSTTKAASEAARMTAAFLVEKLRGCGGSAEAANRIVHELRQLAKTAADNRAFIAEAGAIPLIVPFLSSSDEGLQVNAVTTVLNLSILEENKKRIMKTPGALAGVAGVLSGGATWQAKENAAATLLSLSSLHPLYRRKVGKEVGVAEGLAVLVAKGPTSSKRDGLVAMLHLAGTRDNIAPLVEGGAVEAATAAAADSDIGEIAVSVLAALAKRGAADVVGREEGFVPRMVAVMRHGSENGKESAAAALVSVCRLGMATTMEELSRTSGLEWLLWGLMSSGSVRARRKAATLTRLYRRWTAGAEEEAEKAAVSSMTPPPAATAQT